MDDSVINANEGSYQCIKIYELIDQSIMHHN